MLRAETRTAKILALVDAPEPPLRLLLGSAAVWIATATYPERLVSNAADKGQRSH